MVPKTIYYNYQHYQQGNNEVFSGCAREGGSEGLVDLTLRVLLFLEFCLVLMMKPFKSISKNYEF